MVLTVCVVVAMGNSVVVVPTMSSSPRVVVGERLTRFVVVGASVGASVGMGGGEELDGL